MQAYMKSRMPYLGVTAVPLRTITRAVFADLHFPDRPAWEQEVIDIWTSAVCREEWYCAVELTGHRSARAFQVPEALGLYERLIVEGAWWDIVDTLATHRIRALLVKWPDALRPAMIAWSTDPNLWKRRSAILCQCGLGTATDFDLLQTCIEPSIDSREFFLRKAIGWALREYARSKPEAVISYVRAHKDRLSGLSKREALRHQLATGLVDAIP
jgi:3-methyladenine DNA glycosylase AlkD